MRIDEHGLLVRQIEEYPGNIGDSCAETARYAILSRMFFPLEKFLSTSGFLRHPDAPDGPPHSKTSWREVDATSDQVLPLLMAADLQDPKGPLQAMIRSRLCSTWMVAPGRPAAPALLALAYRRLDLMAMLTRAQTAFFSIPWRWSDDDRLKGKFWKLVRSEGASQDWLNYAVSIIFLRGHGRLIRHDQDRIMANVLNYYKTESNSDWIVAEYRSRIIDGDIKTAT